MRIFIDLRFLKDSVKSEKTFSDEFFKASERSDNNNFGGKAIELGRVQEWNLNLENHTTGQYSIHFVTKDKEQYHIYQGMILLIN